jgi:hypothetical protein
MMAVFSFADMKTANNLIAAHRRGVNVKLVFNSHHVFDAQRKMRYVMGSNVRSRSFVIFCNRACRSNGGEMHSKVFTFMESGQATNISLVGSNNMTSTNAEKQWSDVQVIVGDTVIFNAIKKWHEQASVDRVMAQPRLVAYTPENLLLMTPQNDLETDGDPVLKALGPVVCKVTTHKTDPATGQPVLDPATGQPVVAAERATDVSISAHAWYGPRGHAIARRVADLSRQGCWVRVFHGEAFGSDIRKALAESGSRIRTSRSRGIKTHQKLLIVRGG